MDRPVDADIVIVGGGICGLATALALHRKKIRSLVLEKSETLRATGAAIIVQTNGWRALDQLGIGSTLRQTAIATHGSRFISLKQEVLTEFPFGLNEELRCIKRTDLIKAMADNLPEGTVRTNCQVVSIEVDPLTHYPQLLLGDGSIIQAKVVVGCDGINSAVSSMFGLYQSKLLQFSVTATRGFTDYPNGHQYASELVVVNRGQVQLGRMPVTNKLVYWFVTRPKTSQDSRISKEATLIRESMMESMEGFPEEYVDVIRNCMLNSLHHTEIRYRAPWDLLFSKFRKGTVTVAGDAMHATGPFLAQGGSASIEDAVVLARCLARKMHNTSSNNEETEINMAATEEAFDEYVKERKMRIFWLCLQSFLVGKKLGTKSSIVKFMILAILAILFREPGWHSTYQIGKL